MPAELTVPAMMDPLALLAVNARHAAFAVFMLLVLAAGLGALLSARRAVWQTTLTSAWWWASAALAAWWVVALAAPFVGEKAAEPWLAPLRLAALSLSFCPVVSLLGAKRPQHLAWNFVVLSLWAITALPAAEAFFLQRGGRPEMGDARAWFLWILIALGPINFLATRFWLPSLFTVAAQAVAFGPYLALIRRPLTPQPELIGLLLAVAATMAVWLAARREAKTNNPYNRLWLDFRDTFGMFWALRVQERVNATARQYGWDLELAWSGFLRRTDGAPLEAIDPAVEGALRTTLKGLLRRFVSNEWIARRLDPASVRSSPVP